MRLSIRPTLATVRISKEKLFGFCCIEDLFGRSRPKLVSFKLKFRFSTSVGAARNLTTMTL